VAVLTAGAEQQVVNKVEPGLVVINTTMPVGNSATVKDGNRS